MNKNRVTSAPDLITRNDAEAQQPDDISLHGVAAHVKLLLKIIQDHKDATNSNRNDGRKMLRVATMMTILDNVRSKIQSCQFKSKKPETDLIRRSSSNSDVERDCKDDHAVAVAVVVDEEREMLRKALNASLAARRSLQTFCTSLGKEKEIMSTELSKKVNLLNAMEELISDLEAENQIMTDKVRECVSKHSEELGTDVVGGNIVPLQERNKAHSKQLRCIRNKYETLKWKTKELRAQNTTIRAKMDEIKREVKAGLERLDGLKESFASGSSMSTDTPTYDIQEQITQLEHVFECFERTASNKGKRKDQWTSTPSIFA